MRRAATLALVAFLLGCDGAIPAPGPPIATLEAEAPGAEAQAALRDARALLDIIQTDYAGWPTKSTGPRAAAIREAEAKMLSAARAAQTPSDHLWALSDYVATFGDGHLGLSANVVWLPRSQGMDPFAVEAKAGALGLEPLGVTETRDPEVLRSALQRMRSRPAKDLDPLEGEWAIQGAYRVLVTRNGDVFDVHVLQTDREGWQPGDLKARFARASDGDLVMRYLAGDKSESGVAVKPFAAGTVLDLGRWGMWSRVWPTPEDPQRARRERPGSGFVLERLPDGTPWLRLPSFGANSLNTVQSLIADNREFLESAEYLIVDVRDNGGGNDAVYAPVLPLILESAPSSVGVEFLVTERNLDGFRGYLDEVADNPALAEQLEAHIAALEAKADGQRGVFASLSDGTQTEATLFESAPGTRQVGVLIDNAGSSAEQFVLDVMNAPNVTTFGHANTAGVLDYSNVVSATLPSGRADLRWATSRSLRLPENPVDDGGIAPDVRFGDDTEDPVLAALAVLKEG